MDDVSCDGSEQNLTQCASADIGDIDCDHSEDAGVRCEGEKLSVTVSVRFHRVIEVNNRH